MIKILHAIQWVIWSGSLVYILFCFAQRCQKHAHQLDPLDLTQGWFKGGFKRDTSDFEWNTLKHQLLLDQTGIYYGLHFLVAQAARVLLPTRHLPLAFFICGAIMVTSIFNWQITLITVTNVSIYFMMTYAAIKYPESSRAMKFYCYAFLAGSLYYVHTHLDESQWLGQLLVKETTNQIDQQQQQTNESDYYSSTTYAKQRKIFLVQIIFAWLNAKCLSFVIDSIELYQKSITKLEDSSSSEDCIKSNPPKLPKAAFSNSIKSKPIYEPSFKHLLGFIFYCPTLLTGPLSTYSSFLTDLKQCRQAAIPYRDLVIQLFKYGEYCLLYELLTHIFYSSSFIYHLQHVTGWDSWSLAGFGYALPVMFHIKYSILYGTAATLAKFDGIISIPGPPKCVSRLGSPTLLWRYFDRGLYQWLTSYLYKPIIAGKWQSLPRKVVACGASFGLVALWHGFDPAILIWCAINFVEVCIESRIQKCSKLNLLLGGPLFMIMILSNIFFLGSWDTGWIFVGRFITSAFSSGSLVPLIPTLIIMYSGCQLSRDLINLGW